MAARNNKRSIIARFAILIFAILSIGGLAAMILCNFSPFVNPAQFVWASFFGLAFWALLLFNLLLFFALLVLRSRSVWIPILSLLLAVPGFIKSYSFGKERSDQGNLRVMSYNIRLFRNLNEEIKAEAFADSVVELVRGENPDILCLQEFACYASKISRKDCIYAFAEKIGFTHLYYNQNKNFGGNVIFSKYPITEMPKESYFGSENKGGVMVKVDAGKKGSFYLANLHLLSYQITNDEIDYIFESEKSSEESEKYGKSIFRKLKKAYTKRGHDMQEILSNMPELSSPLIVCGDFNDTPMSYTYQSMKKSGLRDGFIATGKGVGATYAGKLPLLRIDYFWFSDKIVPTFAECLKFKGSDHYPLIMDFKIKD
jgi:Metal-dependent hydrolase